MSELLQVAQFDLNGDYQETEEEILIEGLVFKAGNYPDKNFSMTPEEIMAAVEKFTPQDVDDSHNTNSIFKGKMGKVKEVYSPDNGQTLHAKVGISKWVDKAMGDLKRTVSCTWDRTSKTLAGLALTTTPRIQDAVLYSFFIADQEEKQEQEAEFEGRRNSTADHKTIQSIHDHCMSLGAKCSGDNAEYSSDDPTKSKELPTMSEENKTVDFKDSAEFQAMQAQFATQQAEIERLKADKRHSPGRGRYQGFEGRPKITSTAEAASLLAAFEKALEDDAKYPEKVTFGQGQEGSRFDVLKAIYDARPPAHDVSVKHVPNGSQVLYSHEAKDKKDEPNRIGFPS
jgi:hypothetical protein